MAPGECRDPQRRFKIDEFEDDVCPIIDELFKGDEVDTLYQAQDF